MNYHNITKDDMLNGPGLRVVLWVSGCNHGCAGCHNKQTFSHSSGIRFDDSAFKEICAELEKDYIDGITFSGGDPLSLSNRSTVLDLSLKLKEMYPNKTIWVYTGFEWNNIINIDNIDIVDFIVDGRFINELKDNNFPFAGSTNQKIINVKKSVATKRTVYWNGYEHV